MNKDLLLWKIGAYLDLRSSLLQLLSDLPLQAFAKPRPLTSRSRFRSATIYFEPQAAVTGN
jgi:hypothetical protein